MTANERALRDRLTDEATTWLDDRACEYRYDYERIVDELVDLLIAHRIAAERRGEERVLRFARSLGEVTLAKHYRSARRARVGRRK